MRPFLAALCAAAACSADGASGLPDAAPVITADAAPAPPPLPVGLLVASRGSDVVLAFDGSGASTGVFAADPMLVRPVGLAFGPEGDLYVAAGDTDRVLRFDGATGAARGVFTSGAAFVSPRNLGFGPDGAFYLADGMLGQVLRFDAGGRFDRIAAQHSSLVGPTSFTFSPAGELIVPAVLGDRVLRFELATGAFLGQLVNTGLSQPHDVAYGPDGDLFVTNSMSGLVQRYRDGALVGTFVDDRLRQPLGMAWGPDGNLYIADQGNDQVLRYDGATGARIGVFVRRGAGGLAAPAFLVFRPGAALSITEAASALVVMGARPGARVLLVRGTAGGSGRVEACPDLDLAVAAPQVAATRVADESGNALFARDDATVVAVDAARCAATAAHSASR